MPDRIDLEHGATARMIRSAALEDLRRDTAPEERARSIGKAETALDALCGAHDRRGADGVWDALELLDQRQLLTFATFTVGVLARTDWVCPST
jgi:hypothetical protein